MMKSPLKDAATPMLALLLAGCVVGPRAVGPLSVTPTAIKVCDPTPSESDYYMVNLHVPYAGVLLTSAPCALFLHGCVEHSGVALTPNVSGPNTTLLDVNLSSAVWQKVTTNPRQILLHISLEDPNMHFINIKGDTSFSVQQDKQDYKDKMFECRTEPSVVSNPAFVDVVVNNKTSVPAGSLNIGIDVDESGGKGLAILPIILDPHVPNNG